MKHKESRFQSLLVEAHRLAWQLPVEDYQSYFLEQSCRLLDGDFGAWGIGTVRPAPRVNTVTVQWQGEALISEWVPLAAEDAFVLDCTLSPGRCRTLDDLPQYLETAVYREHWRRFQVRQVMTVVNYSHVENFQTFFCIYRDSLLHPFTARDKHVCQQLAHHLELGWKLNRHLNVERRDSVDAGHALYDRHGHYHLGSSRFCHLCERAGVDHDDHAFMAERMRRPSSAATELVAGWQLTFQPLGDLFLCRIEWHSPIERLTPRRREVARLWGEGLSHKEIGVRMGISPATVRNHLQEVYVRLGVNSKAELVRLLYPYSP